MRGRVVAKRKRKRERERDRKREREREREREGRYVNVISCVNACKSGE